MLPDSLIQANFNSTRTVSQSKLTPTAIDVALSMYPVAVARGILSGIYTVSTQQAIELLSMLADTTDRTESDLIIQAAARSLDARTFSKHFQRIEWRWSAIATAMPFFTPGVARRLLRTNGVKSITVLYNAYSAGYSLDHTTAMEVLTEDHPDVSEETKMFLRLTVDDLPLEYYVHALTSDWFAWFDAKYGPFDVLLDAATEAMRRPGVIPLLLASENIEKIQYTLCAQIIQSVPVPEHRLEASKLFLKIIDRHLTSEDLPESAFYSGLRNYGFNQQVRDSLRLHAVNSEYIPNHNWKSHNDKLVDKISSLVEENTRIEIASDFAQYAVSAGNLLSFDKRWPRFNRNVVRFLDDILENSIVSCELSTASMTPVIVDILPIVSKLLTEKGKTRVSQILRERSSHGRHRSLLQIKKLHGFENLDIRPAICRNNTVTIVEQETPADITFSQIVDNFGESKATWVEFFRYLEAGLSTQEAAMMLGFILEPVPETEYLDPVF